MCDLLEKIRKFTTIFTQNKPFFEWKYGYLKYVVVHDWTGRGGRPMPPTPRFVPNFWKFDPKQKLYVYPPVFRPSYGPVVMLWFFLVFPKGRTPDSGLDLMPCPSQGPKWFWTVQIVLVNSKSFWSGSKFKLDFSLLLFIVWTCAKWFWPDQNELNPSKTIGTWPKIIWQSKIILDP